MLPVLSKKLNKAIKLEKKESTPQTRIPLLTSNAVDLIAETMTDTQSRRDSVEFKSHLLRDRSAIFSEEGEPDQRHPNHRRSENRRAARLDQRANRS